MAKQRAGVLCAHHQQPAATSAHTQDPHCYLSADLETSARPLSPPVLELERLYYPLQAGSCHQCRSLKGEGDRGLGEIGESEY
eukprot:scaffold3766_cov124-Isochrysis_galbana.AAC.1